MNGQLSKVRFAAIGVGVLGLVIGLVRLDGSQFWEDEFFTWWATDLSWDGFDRLIHDVDAVLAPYYLFMRAWTHWFGATETSLRMPSVLAMAAAAALTTRLGSAEFGPRVGVGAGLILVVLPLYTRYAQEARPYALATLAVVASYILLRRAAERAESPWWLVAYGVSLTVVGIVHLIAVLSVAGHLVYVVRRVEPRLRARVAATASLGLVPVLIMVAIGLRQKAQVHVIPLPIPSVQVLGIGVLGLVLMVLASLRAVVVGRAPAYLMAWAVVPPLVLTASHPVIHMFRLRYLIFTLPAWALLAARGLDFTYRKKAWTRWVATFGALALLSALGADAQRKLRSTTGHSKCNYRDAGRYLQEVMTPGDAIAFAGENNRGRHARFSVAYDLRHGPAWTDVFAKSPEAEMGRFNVEECDRPERSAENVARIWMVTCDLHAGPSAVLTGLRSERQQFLAAGFTLESYWSSGDVMVGQFRRKTGAVPDHP